jgi:hypothetical protein
VRPRIPQQLRCHRVPIDLNTQLVDHIGHESLPRSRLASGLITPPNLGTALHPEENTLGSAPCQRVHALRGGSAHSAAVETNLPSQPAIVPSDCPVDWIKFSEKRYPPRGWKIGGGPSSNVLPGSFWTCVDDHEIDCKVDGVEPIQRTSTLKRTSPRSGRYDSSSLERDNLIDSNTSPEGKMRARCGEKFARVTYVFPDTGINSRLRGIPSQRRKVPS